MIDTDKYEGHTPAPWSFKGPQGLDIENGTHAVVSLYDDPRLRIGGEADMQLIADAPRLLEEVKRLQYCLRYVGARLYMDKNNYRHYDYAKLLDFCRRNSGEPDDMSGPMGAMIKDLRYYDGKLEGDEE